MFVEGAPVIARCPLGSRDEAFLTTESFVIRSGNKTRGNFSSDTIRGIRIRHRILWLPLVLGGIITPLALVALVKTFGAFWFLMLTVLAGLFLLYYGYSGSDAVTVTTNVQEYDFFINQVSPHLKAFVAFSQSQLRRSDPNIYISLNKTRYAGFLQSGEIPVGEEVYLSRDQVPPGERILAINARDNPVALHFEIRNESGQANAFLQKPLPFNLFDEVE